MENKNQTAISYENKPKEKKIQKELYATYAGSDWGMLIEELRRVTPTLEVDKQPFLLINFDGTLFTQPVAPQNNYQLLTHMEFIEKYQKLNNFSIFDSIDSEISLVMFNARSHIADFNNLDIDNVYDLRRAARELEGKLSDLAAEQFALENIRDVYRKLKK